MNTLFSTNQMLHECSLHIRKLAEEACPSLAVDDAEIQLYNFDRFGHDYIIISLCHQYKNDIVL